MRIVSLLSFLLATLFFIGGPHADGAIPQPAGYVTDLAGVLTPGQITSLNQVLSDYEQRSSNQIAVLTVKTLEGRDIESYSMEIAQAWKAGQKHKDNGVILLIAPNDRKIRIEVGYGLEGVLTDAQSARIIRNIIAPHFKSGDYYGGIAEAVSAMQAVIGGEFTAEPDTRQPELSFLPIALMLLFLAGLIGLIHWTAGAAAGAFLGGGLKLFTGAGGFGLIPAVFLGLLLGALAPLFLKLFFYSFGRPARGNRWSSRSGYGGFGGAGGWGGFGGSSGGGGGFSGGGGRFGGGGASGSW